MKLTLCRGDDGLVHRRGDSGRWLCGRGDDGSVQREDLDVPACRECLDRLAEIGATENG